MKHGPTGESGGGGRWGSGDEEPPLYPHILKLMAEGDLVRRTRGLVRHQNEIEADLIACLGEIEQRKAYIGKACKSLFAFCVRILNFSEDVAYNYIKVARAALRFPEVLVALREGRVHLTGLRLLAPYFTEDNCADLLAEATGQTRKRIEEIVARLNPKKALRNTIRRERRGGWERDEGASVYREARSSGSEGPECAPRDSTSQPRSDLGDGAVRPAGVGAAPEAAPDAGGGGGAVPDVRGGTGAAGSGHDPGPGRALGHDTGREAGCDTGSEDAAGRDPEPGGSAESWGRPTGPLETTGPGTRQRAPTDEGLDRAFDDDRFYRRPEMKPLSAEWFRLHVTISKRQRDHLEEALDLLSFVIDDGDVAEVIDRGALLLIEKTKKERFGVGRKPRSTAKPKPDGPAGRDIPAAVRREVYLRDGGRCAYVDDEGRRCDETAYLQFHHLDGFTYVRHHDPARIELRCSAHNQGEADEMFGRAFMDECRRKGNRPKE